MDLLVSKCNNKLDRFFTSSRDPWAFGVNALVTQWDQFTLIYAFLLLQILSRLLNRVEMEGILLILVTLNWPNMNVVIKHIQTPSRRTVGPPGLSRPTVLKASTAS